MAQSREAQVYEAQHNARSAAFAAACNTPWGGLSPEERALWLSVAHWPSRIRESHLRCSRPKGPRKQLTFNAGKYRLKT